MRAAAGREIDLPGAAGSGIDPRETPGGDLVKLLHGANPNTVLLIISSFPDSKVERQAPALREFRRVQVPNAESKRVTIPLDADDLAYWDTEKHAFVPGKGKVIISTWASSADLRLMTEIAVK